MEQVRTEPAGDSKQEQWKVHIRRQKESGQTQAAYCAEHGLKLPNFHYWKKKIEDKSPSTGKLRFVPIGGMKPEGNRQQNLEPIRIHVHGITLEVPANTPSQHLVELVRGLGEGGSYVAH